MVPSLVLHVTAFIWKFVVTSLTYLWNYLRAVYLNSIPFDMVSIIVVEHMVSARSKCVVISMYEMNIHVQPSVIILCALFSNVLTGILCKTVDSSSKPHSDFMDVYRVSSK